MKLTKGIVSGWFPDIITVQGGADIRKIRFTMQDGNSHEIMVNNTIFGRHRGRFHYMCKGQKKVCISSGDKAITRLHGERCHFRIFENQNKLYIQDMGSSNGTFIDGKLLPGFVEFKGSKSIPLPVKCTLTVGDTEIIMEALSSREQADHDRIKRRADDCMEYGFYAKASELYLEIGEFALAKEAQKSSEKTKTGDMGRFEKKIIIEPGGHYTEISGHHHVVGAIDQNSRKLVMEQEELKYLQEASKADMEVILNMLGSNGANERVISGREDYGEMEEFVRKIRLDNPNLSPTQLMEMLMGART